MSRVISDNFVKELKTGFLKEVLNAVKCDNRLDIEIRNDFINIYYRGGSLMKVEEKAPGKFEFCFDRKYLDPSNSKVSVGKQLIVQASLQSEMDVQAWIDSIPHIKHEMDLWFSKHPKEEREYQQLVVHENNFGGASKDTDYYICDIEYANSKNKSRFDVIAVKWPSKSADRKNANNLALTFIEMKYMDKALSQKSGIVNHIKDMNNFLSQNNALSDIKNEMKEIFNLKVNLGLLKDIKEIQSFDVSDDCKPDFILLIANHDPEKSVLERELSQLLASSEYTSFKQKADLKIATASYMGYGLYQECIIDFEEFMRRCLYKKFLLIYNNHKNEYTENKLMLKDIIKELNHNFMSLKEYKRRCKAGDIIEKRALEDDMKFYRANPNHPLASENRFVRIAAADKLLRLIKQNTEDICDEIVDILNLYLSDCCAAVRQSLMLSLSLVGNKKSLEFFKRIVNIEESPSTKSMLEYVIDDLELGKNNLLGHPGISGFLS